MSTVRVNFTLPEEVSQRLRQSVLERTRSAFVAEAIKVRLDQLERQQFKQLLVEGYQARREEDHEVNQAWEVATLANWR